MTFKITYSEGDTVNKTVEIEAEGKAKAMIQFWLDHPEADDVSKVERIKNDD